MAFLISGSYADSEDIVQETFVPVSYTHLDVYKRQSEVSGE